MGSLLLAETKFKVHMFTGRKREEALVVGPSTPCDAKAELAQ
jgi:hypothetical protein